MLLFRPSRSGLLSCVIVALIIIAASSCGGKPVVPPGGGGEDSIPQNGRIGKWKNVYIGIKDSANSPDTKRRIEQVQQRYLKIVEQFNSTSKYKISLSFQLTEMIFTDGKSYMRMEIYYRYAQKCFPCTPPPPAGDETIEADGSSGGNQQDN
jgi:hypothetical protein